MTALDCHRRNEELKDTDNVETDEWILDLFKGYHDPCPYRGLERSSWRNALLEEWDSHNFVNPPYSDMLPWVEKSICENMKGKTVVLLVKHDSSTLWFRKLHQYGAHFLFFHGRLKWRGKFSPAWPSCLAILSGPDSLLEQGSAREEE